MTTSQITAETVEVVSCRRKLRLNHSLEPCMTLSKSDTGSDHWPHYCSNCGSFWVFPVDLLRNTGSSYWLRALCAKSTQWVHGPTLFQTGLSIMTGCEGNLLVGDYSRVIDSVLIGIMRCSFSMRVKFLVFLVRNSCNACGKLSSKLLSRWLLASQSSHIPVGSLRIS